MDEEWQVSGPIFRQQISDHRWALNSTRVKTVCNWFVCFISNLHQIWQNVESGITIWDEYPSACKLSSPADASCAILISELQLEINQTSRKILWVKMVTWMWRRDIICAALSAACCTSAALQHCSTVCTAVLGPQSYNLQARDQEGGATNSIQHLHSSFSLFYINYFYILKIFSPARPG